jgi:uncharacterized protein (TIGR02145 family)
MKQFLLFSLIFINGYYFAQKNNIPKELKEYVKGIKDKNFAEANRAYIQLIDYLKNTPEHFSNIENYCYAANYTLNETRSMLIPEKLANVNTSLSEGYHKLCFAKLKTTNSDINQLAQIWNSILNTKHNTWVDTNQYVDSYQIELYLPIYNYYFNQLANSNSESEQNKIINECVNRFPRINYSFGQQQNILNDILTYSETNGTITLFNHSYLNYYLNSLTNENSIEKNFGFWLEPEKDLFNPFTSITKEIFEFENGNFVGKQSIFQNNSLYAELIYNNGQIYNRLKEVRSFKNGLLSRTYFINFPKEDEIGYTFYYFDYQNDENISLKKYKEQLEDLTKQIYVKNETNVENIISNLNSLNYPNELAEVKRFDILKKRWENEKTKRENKSTNVSVDCDYARQKYLEQNQDVKSAGLDPMWHYINYGKKEGRIWPSCDKTKTIENQNNELILSTLEIADDVKNNNRNGTAVNLKSVVIGTQTWTSENLNVSTFQNGDPIPEVRTTEEWKKAGENKQPAWCYYDNDPKNGEKYGKLYNWYAVSDPRGIAPYGWHIPSEEDWLTLEKYLGENIGKEMKNSFDWGAYEFNLKCTNCSSWNDEYRKKTACNICKDTRVNGKGQKSGNGDNSSGFSALPGGLRNYHGSFGDDKKMVGVWWSSTSINQKKSKEFSITSPNDWTLQHKDGYEKGIGCSVRLVKN